MAGLCARSEQCEGDIARKLAAKGMGASDVEWVLGELRERGFVDAVRFARSFTNDKVRFSAWGRIKIRAALLEHTGSLAEVLHFIVKYESAEWQEVSRQLVLKNIEIPDVSHAWVSSLQWYAKLIAMNE